MTEPRRSDTSPQYRAVASGMNLSLDVSHRSASPLRSPPVHVGGTSSQPYPSPPGSGGARLTPKPVAIDMPSPASFDPLLEHFLANCLKNVKGGRKMTIDEITIGFQGHSARLKQRCGKFKRAGDGFQADAIVLEGGYLCCSSFFGVTIRYQNSKTRFRRSEDITFNIVFSKF